MARSKHLSRSAGIHDALQREGDVHIGARAVAYRQRRIWIGIGGLLMMALAGAIYLFVSQPAAPAAELRKTITVRCLACEAEQVLPADPRQAFPVKCSACGKHAAWPLWQCREDGTVFLPEDPAQTVRCPACGSTRVGYVQAPP